MGESHLDLSNGYCFSMVLPLFHFSFSKIIVEVADNIDVGLPCDAFVLQCISVHVVIGYKVLV